MNFRDIIFIIFLIFLKENLSLYIMHWGVRSAITAWSFTAVHDGKGTSFVTLSESLPLAHCL